MQDNIERDWVKPSKHEVIHYIFLYFFVYIFIFSYIFRDHKPGLLLYVIHNQDLGIYNSQRVQGHFRGFHALIFCLKIFKDLLPFITFGT